MSRNAFCQDFDEAYFRKNLNTQSYSIDSEASAVVLFEKYTVEIVKTNAGYQKHETVHKVIRILNHDAVELANVAVFYPDDDMNNYVYKISGTTYNLDGDKLTEAELPKEDKYKKSVGNDHYEVDFIMPSVKEGSIIDYSYTIVSRLSYTLPIWHIQNEYPKLVTEYQLYFPSDFAFTSISKVNEKIVECKSWPEAEKSNYAFCHVSSNALNNFSDNSSFWIRRNVAAIKEEPYVLNIQNEMERLELHMTAYTNPYANNNFMNSWAQVNDVLWNKGKYFKQVENNNDFLDAVIDSISKIDTSFAGKTRNIYSYVRNNFSCRNTHMSFSGKDLPNVFEHKEGNAIEINLLLAAMLTHAGIDAFPIMLSTTSSLPLFSGFPDLDRANYMACAVKASDSSHIYLDATDKNNVYGRLPYYCYNGFAWILGPGIGVYLNTDMIIDKTICGVRISDFSDTGATMEIVEKLGLVQSQILREKCVKDEKTLQTYNDENMHSFSSNITVTESKIDNEKNPDTNLVLRYTCHVKFDDNLTNYYINPVALSAVRENPFKSTVRKHPIEFPYRSEYKYYLNMILPESLEPDTVSAPFIMSYNDESMSYKKIINYSSAMHILALNINYEVKETYYKNDYYASMREFFQKMIKENNEVITLKKVSKK